MINPKCLDCNCQLYGNWDEDPICRKCRIKRNPLTPELIKQAFLNSDSISDGVFYYWMNISTGQISGTCSEGTCDFQYDSLEEFLDRRDLGDLEIQ